MLWEVAIAFNLVVKCGVLLARNLIKPVGVCVCVYVCMWTQLSRWADCCYDTGRG